MANLFLSHSSLDNDFVQRLANDLRDLGHGVWFDVWEIKVGECIVTKVQEGIANADYVIIILTPEAVASGWVEREWKDAYWTEVSDRRLVVLPALLRPCDVPTLLRTKRYADFTKRYELGIAQLSQALPLGPEPAKEALRREAHDDAPILSLIAEVQIRRTPVSASMAGALDLARKRDQADLVEFCTNELSGWKRNLVSDQSKFSYRSLPVFVTLGMVNPSYIGWGESAGTMFTYMEAHPEEFFPRTLLVSESVGKIEARLLQPANTKTFLKIPMRVKDIVPDAELPDQPVGCYARGDAYTDVLENIRGELTRRLLALLPGTPAPADGA